MVSVRSQDKLNGILKINEALAGNVDLVLNECSAILSENTARDPRVADSESLAALTFQSTMCAPMLGVDGKPFGIISLDSQDPHRQFSSDDLQLLVAVASQASHSFENARLMKTYMEKLQQDHELRISAQIQKALIPELMPEPSGYGIFGSYDAAKTVGGDQQFDGPHGLAKSLS